MILTGLGAALGAIFRYFLTVTIKPNHSWPKTIFFINITGAFCLGFLFALGVDKNAYTFLGIGILGGYTTFSTLNKESVALRKTKIGLLYTASSYLLGLLLVHIGFHLGKMIQTRKVIYLVIKIIVSLAFVLSLLFLLTSSINTKSNNSRLYAKRLITEVADDSGYGNLSSLFVSSGLEDEVLNHLPKKTEVNITPPEVYNLSSTYEEKGKFSSNDLKLPAKASGEKFISKYIVAGINVGLKRNNEDVKNATNLYQLVYYIPLLCLVISIILVLFGKRFAGLTVILSSVGMLVGLSFASEKATATLDEILCSDMKVTISPNFLTAVIIVVIANIVWEVVCHNYRKTLI